MSIAENGKQYNWVGEGERFKDGCAKQGKTLADYSEVEIWNGHGTATGAQILKLSYTCNGKRGSGYEVLTWYGPDWDSTWYPKSQGWTLDDVWVMTKILVPLPEDARIRDQESK
jgi:hypothetical protein